MLVTETWAEKDFFGGKTHIKLGIKPLSGWFVLVVVFLGSGKANSKSR